MNKKERNKGKIIKADSLLFNLDNKMANHKSSLKRIRQTENRRLHNRFYARAMRSAVRSFRALTDKNEAESKLSEMYKTIDRVAKRGIIHRNKAANLKSKLAHFTAKLA